MERITLLLWRAALALVLLLAARVVAGLLIAADQWLVKMLPPTLAVVVAVREIAQLQEMLALVVVLVVIVTL
jgi:hypothetical protein